MAGGRVVAMIGPFFRGICTAVVHEIPHFVSVEKYYSDTFKFLGAAAAIASAAVGLNNHYREETVSRLESKFKTQLGAFNIKIDACLIVANDVKTDMILLKADIVVINKKLDDIDNKLDAMTRKK